MSLAKVGALIAIEREIKLKSYIDKHIRLDALVSKDMLLTIFHAQHAAARRGGDHFRGAHRRRQLFFPLPAADGADPGRRPAPGRHRHQPGDRLRGHRVSEQTGKISLAVNGELIRGLDREGLKNRLKFLRSNMTERLKKLFSATWGLKLLAPCCWPCWSGRSWRAASAPSPSALSACRSKSATSPTTSRCVTSIPKKCG